MKNSQHPRFRFGLRALLSAVTGLCAFLATAPHVDPWLIIIAAILISFSVPCAVWHRYGGAPSALKYGLVTIAVVLPVILMIPCWLHRSHHDARSVNATKALIHYGVQHQYIRNFRSDAANNQTEYDRARQAMVDANLEW